MYNYFTCLSLSIADSDTLPPPPPDAYGSLETGAAVRKHREGMFFLSHLAPVALCFTDLIAIPSLPLQTCLLIIIFYSNAPWVFSNLHQSTLPALFKQCAYKRSQLYVNDWIILYKSSAFHPHVSALMEDENSLEIGLYIV